MFFLVFVFIKKKVQLFIVLALNRMSNGSIEQVSSVTLGKWKVNRTL